MVKIIYHNKVIDNITPTPTPANHSESADGDQFKQLSLNNTSNSKVIHHANCICEPLISPTKTPTLTPTPSRTPANSATPTPTTTPTITPTLSPTITLTRTPTSSQSPTPTPTATPPSSPCPPCPSQTPPPTPSSSPTRTPTPSSSPTRTPTPSPSSPENCCEWDGNGTFYYYEACGWAELSASLTKVSDYQWSIFEALECGEFLSVEIVCNANVILNGNNCDQKWTITIDGWPCLDTPLTAVIITPSNINTLGLPEHFKNDITSRSIWPKVCDCNIPPAFAIIGQVKPDCNCCTPTPTPTPTITPSSSYNYYSYFANIIP